MLYLHGCHNNLPNPSPSLHHLPKMADINVSTQEKGYQNPEVSTPLFIHPLLDQATTDEVLVDFDGGDDPYRPMNWPFRKKVITTILYGLTTCWITFASAVYSATVNDISREFHIGYEVSTLGTSLFVVGFGLGPLIFAPLSELYGRKPAVLIVSSIPIDIGTVLTSSAIFCRCSLFFRRWGGKRYPDNLDYSLLCWILW